MDGPTTVLIILLWEGFDVDVLTTILIVSLYASVALSCLVCFWREMSEGGSSFRYLTAPQRCGVRLVAASLALFWPVLPLVALLLWTHDVLRHD